MNSNRIYTGNIMQKEFDWETEEYTGNIKAVKENAILIKTTHGHYVDVFDLYLLSDIAYLYVENYKEPRMPAILLESVGAPDTLKKLLAETMYDIKSFPAMLTNHHRQYWMQAMSIEKPAHGGRFVDEASLELYEGKRQKVSIRKLRNDEWRLASLPK